MGALPLGETPGRWLTCHSQLWFTGYYFETVFHKARFNLKLFGFTTGKKAELNKSLTQMK